MEIKIPKKLIEVALPLDSINKAAVREKSIRHGHPSTLHLWWARRPLAAARAVLFAQLVNDPGYERSLGRGVNKIKAAQERERLFKIIERLVQWESTSNEEVLKEARDEIIKSWQETCELNKDHPQAADLFNPNHLPAFHDPFAGGGAIPLEAQRLGLDSYASDLNPVAVAINKAMIEIPPRFESTRPIGPIPQGENQVKMDLSWSGAKGMAEDVRRYGHWMRSEAIKKIGNLYPFVRVTAEVAEGRQDLLSLVGQDLTVISWIWARTVRSPNPAFSHVEIPLVSTFVLSSKEGREAYVEPLIEGDRYSFRVRTGIAPKKLEAGTTAGKRAAFICLMSGVPVDYDYIRTEGKAGRIGNRLMAVVTEGPNGRLYLNPQKGQIDVACSAKPTWVPEMELPHNPRDFKTPNYGLTKFGDLFSARQLVALNTFSELIKNVIAKCESDAIEAGFENDPHSLELGGKGSKAYAQAIALYLSFVVDKCSDYWSAVCSWHQSGEKMRNTFGRQAIPMVWDFAEANPFCESSGNWIAMVDWTTKALAATPGKGKGTAVQAAAQTQSISFQKIVSTDPPYYDNIGYADLSDFFYVWMRRSMKDSMPALFQSVSVPKGSELVATPYRHGGKDNAEQFFLNGMKEAIHSLALNCHPAFPVTIYYAFKQSETKDNEGTSSAGWETFLEAVLQAGFSITGTWPMRTELGNRMIGSGKNALASSVVLVCKRREEKAPSISRREFIRELNMVLPEALAEMTTGGEHSPVAPVDLSQAMIGPGMAIFSKYSAVLEADGRPMPVRTALQLINRFIAEEDFDSDTQFCLQWFEGNYWNKGRYGDADVLARAKGTSAEGLKDGGIVESSGGFLRLMRFSELSISWKPEDDVRISIWEILHHMIREMTTNGESAAGEILARTHNYSESVRTLAYRLYTICERKGWAQDAGSYDSLVRAWDSIETSARAAGYTGTQISLFGSEEESSRKVAAKKATKIRIKK